MTYGVASRNLECAKSFVEAKEDWSRSILHHLVPNSFAQTPECLEDYNVEKASLVTKIPW